MTMKRDGEPRSRIPWRTVLFWIAGIALVLGGVALDYHVAGPGRAPDAGGQGVESVAP